MTITTATSPTGPGDLLTIDDFAERIRKTRAGVEWMIHRGTAPRSAKIGGRRMFRAADVDAWIDAQFEAASA